MNHPLDRFLRPKSVAVIGASRSPRKVGHQLLKNLIEGGFSNPIYPVNPQARNLSGLPCYPSVTALPRIPDLAVMVTPAPLIPLLLTECGQIGLKQVVIITAGFAETGPKGRQLQQQLTEIAALHSLSLLGPNCLGVINPHTRLNASFGPALPERGSVFLISQSGAMITSILDWAASSSVGFSGALSLGNRIGLNETDCLNYAAHDPATRVIAVYLESFAHAGRFFSAASRIIPKKPIILLTGGTSAAGQRASASHTAALATNSALLQGITAQTGVISAASIETWLSAILLAQTFPPFQPNITLLTNAGGPGVVASDHAAYYHLALPPFRPRTASKLGSLLHRSKVANPLDLLGDAAPETIYQAVKICLNDPQISGLLTLITPQSMTQPVKIARLLVSLPRPRRKPLIFSFMGGHIMNPAVRLIKQAGLVHFPYPNDALEAYSLLGQYYQQRRQTPTFPASRPRSKQALLAFHSGLTRPDQSVYFRLLQTAGINVPKFRLISSLEAIPSALKYVGRPAVIKNADPRLAHKKQAHGVFLDIMTVSQARLAFRRLIQAYPQVLFQQSVHAPLELILGAKRDPAFGAFLTIGLGGSFTNLYHDRQYVFLPANRHSLLAALNRSHSAKFLEEIGAGPNLIIEAMEACQDIMLSLPNLAEMEINPLMISPRQVYAADIKITYSLVPQN